jgi:hypothetical protein
MIMATSFLKVVSVVVTLFASSPGNAVTYFSITDNGTNCSLLCGSTVTGTIGGLNNAPGVQQASEVSFTSPFLGNSGNLIFPNTGFYPFSVINANAFTVTTGVITSANFSAMNTYSAGCLCIDFSFGETFAHLDFSFNPNGAIYILNGPITFSANTPLPASFPLFAGGLAVMGLLSRRRKKAELLLP